MVRALENLQVRTSRKDLSILSLFFRVIFVLGNIVVLSAALAFGNNAESGGP